jgi:hypothetical protein
MVEGSEVGREGLGKSGKAERLKCWKKPKGLRDYETTDHGQGKKLKCGTRRAKVQTLKAKS